MWRVAPYIYKHVNNNYYVRVRIPKDLLPIARIRELKLSIGPTAEDKLRAIRLGAYAATLFREQVLQIKKTKMEYIALSTASQSPRGVVVFSSKQEEAEFRALIDALIAGGNQSKQFSEDIATDWPVPPFASADSGQRSQSQEKASKSFDDLIAAFLQHKRNTGDCKEESLQKTLGYCKVLQEVLEAHDQPVRLPAQMTPATADYVFSMLNRYPKNRTTSQKFREQSLNLAMRIADESEVLSAVTVSKYLECFRALFKFAIAQREYGVTANPFEGKQVSKKAIRKESNERVPFTAEETNKLFSGDIFGAGKYDLPFVYWVLPIYYFTGCRREEIAQLRCRDIKMHGDIWVFVQTEDHETKRLKTSASERLVPIHSRLIEMGLIEYRDRIVEMFGKDAQLFPELTFQKKHGYGRNIARYFLGEGSQRKAAYFKRVGVKQRAKDLKDIHAFRHTLITLLQEAGVALEIREAIAGHDGDLKSSTNKRYSHGDLVPLMKQGIESIKPCTSLANIKPFNFSQVVKKLRKVKR